MYNYFDTSSGIIIPNLSLFQFQRIIDYLKVDVEFSEWESFENMLKDGFLRTQVRHGTL